MLDNNSENRLSAEKILKKVSKLLKYMDTREQRMFNITDSNGVA